MTRSPWIGQAFSPWVAAQLESSSSLENEDATEEDSERDFKGTLKSEKMF